MPKTFGVTTGCGTMIGTVVNRSALPAKPGLARHADTIAAKATVLHIARQAQSRIAASVAIVRASIAFTLATLARPRRANCDLGHGSKLSPDEIRELHRPIHAPTLVGFHPGLFGTAAPG